MCMYIYMYISMCVCVGIGELLGWLVSQQRVLQGTLGSNGVGCGC